MSELRCLAAAAALIALLVPGPVLAADRPLVIAQSVDVESLEPDDINSASSINVADMLWGTLLKSTPDGQIVPSLASAYHWNDAGNEISFTLKPGLKCEDGSPLTAADVVYSFTRAADKKLAFIGALPDFIYSSIGYQGARQDGDLTATVLVKGYSSQTPGMFTMAPIICKAPYVAMTREQAAAHPAATGPYRLGEWVRDDHLTLIRNENYSLGQPAFGKVVFRVIPESSTRAAELIAGNVDLITNVAPDQRSTIDGSGTAEVKSVNGTRRMFVGFNFTPAFAKTPGGAAIQKKAVRQALEYAVDVPTICQQLLQTNCRRMAGPANLGDPKIEPYPFDPNKAEALLDAAGYKRDADGVRFQLTLQSPRGRYLADADVAQAVAQYLSDVGVPTKVETMDFISIFMPRALRHEAGPLFFAGQGGVLWSAVYDLSLFSAPTAGPNNGQWFDPQFQAAFDSLKNIRDPVVERGVVDHMLQIFADECPWIFLYFQPDSYGVSHRLEWQPRRDELIDVMTIKAKN